VFGSVARGDARPGSDVDLLVDMEEGKTYFDLVNLWMETQELLGWKVEVLTEPEVSPSLRKRVLQEAVAL
jgi:predicted nucleotidyltransferase